MSSHQVAKVMLGITFGFLKLFRKIIAYLNYFGCDPDMNKEQD